jgi:2'-5' RNA ligase
VLPSCQGGDMRVFAALILSAESVAGLDSALAPERPKLPQMQWTPPDDWHVALAYFGNISRADFERLETAMTGVSAAWPPLEVRVKGIGAFPEPHEATALWANVYEEGDRLGRLSSAVTGSVKGFGWMLDRRVFRPQVALGRSKEPVDARRVLSSVGDYEGPSWTFDTIATLFPRPKDNGAVEMDIVGMYPMHGPARSGSG